METEPSSRTSRSTIRYSRVLGPFWTLALGSSVTIGVGVFILLGQILPLTQGSTPLAYGLAVLTFIPLGLTYAERAANLRDGEGAFRLMRPNEPSWLVYAGSWLSLIGYASLIGLLGWGAMLHFNLFLARLFDATIDMRVGGPVLILLVAWNSVLGPQGSWRARSRMIYLCILILAGILGLEWFSSPGPSGTALPAQDPNTVISGMALLAAALWGLGLILDFRDKVRRPRRSLLPTLVGTSSLGYFIGMIAAIIILDKFGGSLTDPAPLATLAVSIRDLVEVIYLLAGLLLCLIALDRMLVSNQRQVGAMVQEGYLPATLEWIHPKLTITLHPLLLVVILSLAAISALPILILVGTASFSFLWIMVLVNGRDLLQRQERKEVPGRITLPLHPLIPGLGIAASIFLCFGLPINVWLIGLAWGGIGAIYYQVYGREGGISARKRERVIGGDTIPSQRKKGYRVLVGVNDPENLPSLIQAGARFARANQGDLLVLQVVVQPEQMPVYLKKQAAQSIWSDLKELIREINVEGVAIEPLVRLAPSQSTGILETVQEEDIDLVLLGWEKISGREEVELEPLIDEVVRSASCDVGVLRGHLSAQLKKVMVSTAGGPHATEGLRYGKWLVDPDEGQVTALNIIRGSLTSTKEARARELIGHSIEEIGDASSFKLRIAPSDDVKRGILRESVDYDLLLLGSSNEGLLDQAVFEGIPAEVAQTRKGATLLIKHFEGTGQFWLRRAWEAIYEPFPTLSVSERAEVYLQMRHYARAGIDYYMLIILAAIIAFMGLVLNSAAVIIGAMLVAPLMSPILAIANSIVQGNVRMLAQAGESTIKGVTVTVGVSVLAALILPNTPPTGEILARTSPNLLDLMVAMASGAAAAYASSRRQLAAALPGVAIAAALLPPLAVVGYGLGSSAFSLAGGALLLFITNLSAIVLAGATIFLLLGFRPTRAERGQYMRRGILISVLALLVIAMPLGITSITFRRQIERQFRVETVLSEAFPAGSAQVGDFQIQRQGNKLVVDTTIYLYKNLNAEQLTSDVQSQLSQAIGEPVTIRAKIIKATLTTIESDHPPDRTPTPTATGIQ
jgi:uncharacterized hydrophobic protein (TIGR00271 family)